MVQFKPDREVVVVGVGLHPFGRFRGKDLATLARESVVEALKDCGVRWRDVPVAYFGHVYYHGMSVGETALALERAMLSSGLNATPLSELFAAGQAFLRGILGLFQGFLGLGLVVGIAGLGVISSRTVVERRQQIGVLRAIGYRSGTVALLFVLEANFIALTGILVGGVTGVILGDKTIGQAYDLATQQSFPTPWLTIAAMLAAAWLFSLLTTILPAWQASRIYPAEALRYE